MPFLGLLGTLLVGGIFWYIRHRGAVGAIEDVVDVAQEARNAPRRMRFKKNANTHPVEQSDDTDELIAAFCAAFIGISHLPDRETQQQCIRSIARAFNTTTPDAEELFAYGRWLAEECGTADQAMARLGKRLYKLDAGKSFPQLMTILSETQNTSSCSLTSQQKEALERLKSDFRIQ